MSTADTTHADQTARPDPGTDAFAEAVDVPEGWTLANNHDDHLTFLHTAEPDVRERHTLVVMHDTDHVGEWKLVGLTGYQDNGQGDRAFAIGVPLGIALRSARTEMAAVVDENASTFSKGDDVHDYKQCDGCGRRWTRDPVLEVECPSCDANVGVGCERPSGHSGPMVQPHEVRGEAAIEAGVYPYECGDEATTDGRVNRDLASEAPAKDADSDEAEASDDGTDEPRQASLTDW